MALRLTLRTKTDSESTFVYVFDQHRIVIGRGQSSDVRIPHRTVSERHASIRVQGTDYVLVDEGSTNGTFVNDVPLVSHRPKILRKGDTIRVGNFEMDVALGVSVTGFTSLERTAALARRMVREVIDQNGPGAAPPQLTILDGAQRGERLIIPEPPSRLIIGRSDQCDLKLVDADASREHVELVRDLDGVLARDLGSKNGLVINDRRTHEKRLRDRDEILIGATLLVFQDPAEHLIRAMESEEDLPFSEGGPSLAGSIGERPEPTQDGPASTNIDVPSVESARSPRPHTSPVFPMDSVIYILAAVILLSSLIALVMLFRAE